MDRKTEEQLIRRAKEDKQAFATLYDYYYPKIYKYILRRTANIEISLDITAEVFFKALKNIKNYQWKEISFSSWLYKVATNQLYDYFRNKKKAPISLDLLLARTDFEPSALTDIQEEIILAEESVKKHKDFLQIHRKLTTLPLIYQEVVTLRFFEKKKIKQISEILGRSEGTIKSQLSRAIALLKAPQTTIKKKSPIKKPAMQPFPNISVIPIREKIYEK